MKDDPESRLRRLATLAQDRGELDACFAYQHAAIRRGDELLAGMGGPLFGPISDALQELIAHNPAQLRK